MSKIYRPQFSFYLDDDICFCADSDRCTNTECFRHLTHKNEPGIFTCSHLMDTEYCPMNKEGED